MPYIRVNPDHLANASEDLEGICSKVSAIESSFLSACQKLNWEVKNKAEIDSKLNNIENSLQEEMTALQAMSGFLNNSYYSYMQVSNQRIDHEKYKNSKSPVRIAWKLQDSFEKISHADVGEAKKTSASFTFSSVLDFAKKALSFGETIVDTVAESIDAIDIDSIFAYGQSFVEFFVDGEQKWSNIFDLASCSSKLYSFLWETLKSKGIASEGFGIFGDVLGIFTGLAEVMEAEGFEGIEKALDNLMNATIDTGGTIVGILTDAAKMPVHCLTTLVKTIKGSAKGVYDSILRDTADGSYSFDDFLDTMVNMSVGGLNDLVSGFTFGLLSLENAGLTPEEASARMEQWAEDFGSYLGNQIVSYKRSHANALTAGTGGGGGW